MSLSLAVGRRRAVHSLLNYHQHHDSTLLKSILRLASSASSTTVGPITQAYQDQISSGRKRSDGEQFQLTKRLDSLHDSLLSTDSIVLSSEDLYVYPKTTFLDRGRAQLAKATSLFLMRPAPPKGLYIHGSVGVGKSFLMDLFHETLVETQAVENRKIRRVHFHEFMLDVHGRMHQLKQQRAKMKGDVLSRVALSLAQESRVLCFDEFQVTDIADAMILKQLFEILLDAGVVVVATSNRAPESLYEGGINRDRFLPFLDTLRSSMDVVEMTGTYDYRQEQENDDTADEHANNHQTILDQCYFLSTDTATPNALKRIFNTYGGSNEGQEKAETLSVPMGRSIHVTHANSHCAWFHFDDLCLKPLGPADYLALCRRYPVLIVDNIPQLNSSRINEARRFVTLIDALYESKTKLAASVDVPMEDLFVDFDVTLESQDGDEELTANNNNTNDDMTMFVEGKGGSSSSAATTMLKTKDGTTVEWSATGRVGVSLAQLSSVSDISFSFQRAQSRLQEMKRTSWGRRIG